MRALAQLHGEQHDPGLDAFVDLHLDARGEVALGGGGLARFAHRLLRQAPQLLGRHLPVAFPALEVQSLAQKLADFLRRIDLDAVLQAGLRKARACSDKAKHREEPAHRVFDSACGDEL